MNKEKPKSTADEPANEFKETLILGIKEFLHRGEKIIESGQMTLDDYLAKRTENLDNYILQEQSTKKLEYVSGEVSITKLGTDKFIFSFDLYFTDIDRKWVKNSHADSPKPMDLYFKKEDQALIAREGKISYTYEKPST